MRFFENKKGMEFSTIIGIVIILIIVWGIVGSVIVNTLPNYECTLNMGPLCYSWREKSVVETIFDFLGF
jgi:hypothetical protein